MDSFQKALIEGLRVVVLAIIPLLITSLQDGALDVRLLLVTIAIAALRALDKYLHIVGKEEGDDILITGLTRF